jgi:hypothetical protein
MWIGAGDRAVGYLDDGVAGVGNGRFGNEADLDTSSAHPPSCFHFVRGMGDIACACNGARSVSNCCVCVVQC